jgi:carboxyl-terminal processing protease
MFLVRFRALIRARLLRLLAPLAALLAAACAGPYAGMAPPPSTTFTQSAATQMFTAGYDNIQEYFIEPVKLSDVATRGLNGLKAIEPGLVVEREPGGVVRLALDATVLGRFAMPREDDPLAWGQLTANAVVAGRDGSAALAESVPETIYKAVFDAALGSLDRFSRYATAEAANDNRAQRDGFGGIGVTLAREENPRRVAAVIENTPAARAGLQVDDLLTHVDGRPLSGLQLNDIVRHLRGPIDSTVSVTLERAGASLTVNLQRALIVPPTVTYRREGDIVYFRVSGFNQRTAQTMRTRFADAKAEIGPRMVGLVLDLRGNPGGLLDQAVAMSNLFIAEGEIVSIRGRHLNSRQQFESRREDITRGLPIVVLIDHHSASAAEIVAAALQDSGRALVIGTRSFGKGTVQTVQRMPNGGEMTLTWARFFAPTGYPLQDIGVMPTVCTSLAGSDPGQVVAAIRANAPRVSNAAPRPQRMTPVEQAQREKLGKSCPARPGGGDLEVEVARQLLEDAPLFARALTLQLGDLSPDIATATH